MRNVAKHSYIIPYPAKERKSIHMANETNITIRCQGHVKDMFNAVSKSKPHLAKGELLEQMIKSYNALDAINVDTLNVILELSKYNHEYLGLLIKHNKSIPTNMAILMKSLNEEAVCDKYIKMKLGKDE